MFTATTLLKLSLALLTASSTMVASLPPSNSLKPTLHRRVCHEGETANLYCYTEENGGIPQEVSEDDIKYAASYLRSYGRQVRAGRLLTMGPSELGTCDEWTLYQRGSVLVTAKHINDTANSAVLFEDVATTIDGGPGATDAQKAKAIIGCLSDGGSLGVMVNRTHPMYNSTTYVTNRYTSSGIVIKVVSSGQ